jgi:hypothetical protein
MKHILIAGSLIALITNPVIFAAAADNTDYENQVYTEAVKIETQVLNGERDGSLKKPQVHQLLSRLNDVENRLDNDTTKEQFGPSEATEVEKNLQQIKKEMTEERQANLGRAVSP